MSLLQPSSTLRVSLATFSLVAGAVLVLAAPVTGQGRQFAIFAGYSTRADIVLTPVNSVSISIPNIANLNGWNASFEAKLIPVVGLVADVSGHYGSFRATLGCEVIQICVPPSANVHTSLYSLMFGPQLSVPLWRFRPFAHALFGVAHINHKADLIALSGLSNADTSFAYALGGGVDFRIVASVSARLQADLLATQFFGLPAPVSFLISGSQNGARVSFGVVYRF